MAMKRAYRYRIYPKPAQITKLENTFSMCRHLYNWSLKERIESYQKEEISITYNSQQNNLPELKKERPWFKSVYSQVLQDTLRRLDRAYQNFFRRIKEGREKAGFPKFKKRGQWNSITYPQYSGRPEGGTIKVPKIGDIDIVYHREIPKNASIKTLNISKDGGKWFACFSFEFETQLEPKQELAKSVGIDLGLIDFYYPTEGEPVKVPRYMRKLEKKLQKLQRRLSKCERRSPRYMKILKALKKVHYRVRCQRQDFLHKKANELLSRYDLIVHEKLNIRGMIRRPKPKQDESGQYLPNGAAAKGGLNKSIADVGWYKFLSILEYKAQEMGKMVRSVRPHFTSQICSNCGAIVEKSLSTRTHICTECGYIENRDKNAAINILRLGMESLGLPLEAPSIMSLAQANGI